VRNVNKGYIGPVPVSSSNYLFFFDKVLEVRDLAERMGLFWLHATIFHLDVNFKKSNNQSSKEQAHHKTPK
jgi:hypothetical protein